MADSHTRLHRTLASGRGTTQQPVRAFGEPDSSGVGMSITDSSGLPNIATIVEDASQPSNIVSGTGQRLVFKPSPGNLAALTLYLSHASQGQLGAQIRVVVVTERDGPNGKSWQRRVACDIDLATTSSAAAADVDGQPSGTWYFVDSADVVEDYTLAPGVRIVSEAAGNAVEVLIDFLGNGWIEIYGDITKGTLGTNNAQAIWAEAREL